MNFKRPRGRPPRVKQAVDPEYIASLQQDFEMYEKFEQLNKTEGGKRLLKLLSDSVDDTTKHWLRILFEGVANTDKDKLFKDFCVISSKHQTLRGFENKVRDAESSKLQIQRELEEIEMKQGEE